MTANGLKRPALFPLLAVLVLPAACGGGNPDPPDSSDPPGGAIRITGNERLGWDQAASAFPDSLGYRFSVYVDNARVELPQASCAGTSNPGRFACSSPLPQLSPGEHRLEVVAWVSNGGNRLESPRAPALVVIVGAGVDAPGLTPSADQSSDAVAEAAATGLDVLAAGLQDPRSLTLLADGRVMFVDGERLQVLRRDGQLSTLLNAGEGAGTRVLGLAVHPEFDENGLLYVAYATPAGAGSTLHVERFRELAGRLGERAQLFQTGLGASADSLEDARLRIGPDDRLHLVVRARPGAARGLVGALMRLNLDGTTPADNPSGSPVLARIEGGVADFDWDPGTGSLWWMVGPGLGESHRLASVARLDGRTNLRVTIGPTIGGPQSRASDTPVMAFLRETAGSERLLVGMGQDLVRVDPGVSERVQVAPLWASDRFAILDVAAGRDGTVVLALRDAASASARAGMLAALTR